MSSTKNLSVSIDLDAQRAYDILSQPSSFVKWASGLAGTLEKVGGEWLAQTPEGPMKVRFSERNAHGVLDHWVYPKPGVEVYIPLRVIRNGDGCELVLTLFRQPGMTDEKFAADADWVARDLKAAKSLLEGYRG